MVELGELESRKQEFLNRKVTIYAISNDDRETAALTQASFPGLKIVSDANQEVATTLGVLHPGGGPGGGDTNAPTTFLVDGTGKVQRVFRESRFLTRTDPDTELRAIDELLAAK